MKTRSASALAIGALSCLIPLLSACAGVRAVDLAGVERLSLAELRDSPEEHAEAFSTAGKGLVIEIPAGETVPIAIDVRTSPFVVEGPGTSAVRFERDVYLYVSSSGVMLSPDGESWAPIQDLDALKEAFGIERGSLSLGFGVSSDEGAVIHFKLTAE